MDEYVFTQPPTSLQAEGDTRSIFKLSTTDLNSEFSFSLVGCYTKV